MGQRGPLRQPFSKRGLQQSVQPPTAGDASVIPMPDWLPKKTHAAWDKILGDLCAAGVPLKPADAPALGMYVLSLHLAQESAKASERERKNSDRALRFAQLAARFGRDALAWSAAIGGTPGARARMSVPVNQEPAGMDDLERALCN